MAAATCTAAGLVTAGTCFTGQNFGPHDQKAILAYLWWQWADSVQNGSSLITAQNLASSCLNQSLTEDMLMAGLIGVLNRGSDGVETLSSNLTITALTKETAASAIECLRNFPDEQLDAMIVYNTCRFFGGFA